MLLDKNVKEVEKKKFDDFIDKIEINKKLMKYERVKTDIEKYMNSHHVRKSEDDLCLKNEIIERYLSENWIEAKKNLYEWADLEKVSHNSEF